MDTIPLTPDDNNARIGVALGSERFWFTPRWNQRDNDGAGAWYLDIRQEDNEPVAMGLKLNIGVELGRRSSHPFFKKHFLRVVDTANSGVEASFDDLGNRIILTHFTLAELKRGGS